MEFEVKYICNPRGAQGILYLQRSMLITVTPEDITANKYSDGCPAYTAMHMAIDQAHKVEAIEHIQIVSVTPVDVGVNICDI